MIQRYKDVSIIYGGSGREYAEALNDRILTLSEEEHYPIKATMINERILTRELLSDVIALFKESEFCVAFLTEEDCSLSENGEKKRLRQNVVFEIGMAIIELGRERCILLSDFDTEKPDFELPSDMNSLEIKCFEKKDFSNVLGDIIEKLLKFSQHSVVTGVEVEDIPQYDYLLSRLEYRIDYENIFVDRPVTLATEGHDFFFDTLTYWIDECSCLPHYDEKCIYLLERIGFLPIFGKIPAAVDFLKKSENLIEDYHNSDIKYYGNTELLEFTRNTVLCVIEYTVLKTKNQSGVDLFREYKNLLQNFQSEEVPETDSINPLILEAYYDYVGLTYLRLYNLEKTKEHLQNALESFEKATIFASEIDMSLQIWSGFLTYNIARVLAELNQPSEAEKNYKKAIKIRGRWLKNTNYNITVRNALSYEYFIARIGYLDLCQKYNLMTSDEIRIEYGYVEKELNIYSDMDEKLYQLMNIRKMLQKRIEVLKK